MEANQDVQRVMIILKRVFENQPKLNQLIESFQLKMLQTLRNKQSQLKKEQKISFEFAIDKVTRLGSLSNQVYQVNLKNGRCIIVKYYFDTLKDFVQRDIEHELLSITTKNLQYPYVFYKDCFCRVEAFIPGNSLLNNQGQTIHREQLNLALLLKITQSLANFSIKYSEIAINPSLLNLRQISGSFELYNKIYMSKKHSNPEIISKVQHLMDKVFSKQKIKNLQKCLQNQKMIMSHNDVNLSNILIMTDCDSQTYSVQLLDFQFANFNYIGYDLGNMLNQVATDYGGAYANQQSVKLHFFQIRKDWELDHESVNTITNLYFDMIEGNLKTPVYQRNRFVKIGRLLSHLFWLFVGLKQIDDPSINLDMVYYVQRRSQEFIKLYDQIIRQKQILLIN